MNNFWNNLPKPFFILAPMEAVTDIVFRQVIAKAGRPDVFFTEFTNTDSWCSPKGQHSTRGRLAIEPNEHPVVAHIWGDNPGHFAEMSQAMAGLGFAGIDINMGCPSSNIAPRGKGSGLINHPKTAEQVIAACKTSGLPVSVKTRLGYTNTSETAAWLTHLLEQDIANLSIHLRTRKEMSKVAAHYELIGEIVNLRDKVAPQTLLTINGDIRDRGHGLQLIRENPGVDGVMIGRGVFKNPFAFALEPNDHSHEDLIALLNHQLNLYDKYQPTTGRPYETLKRFFKIYIRDFDGASEIRDQLMHTKSTDEARRIIN